MFSAHVFYSFVFVCFTSLSLSVLPVLLLICQCIHMPHTLSIWFDVSLSGCMCCSLICFFFLSLSLSLYLCFSISLSLSLSLYVSVSLSLSLSLSLSVSLYLSVSQSLHLTSLHPGTVSPPIPHPKAFPPLFPQGRLLGILTGGATNFSCITARKLFLFLCFFFWFTQGRC